MLYRHLTLEERRTLFRLLNAKVPVAEIARQLGRHRSTIFREISRNLFRDVKEYRGYYPITAEDSAKRRRQRRRKLIEDARLRQHVTEMLAHWWSPEQIAGRLKLAGDGTRLCHETIYQFIYSPEGRALRLHRHLLRARRLRRRRFDRKPRGAMASGTERVALAARVSAASIAQDASIHRAARACRPCGKRVLAARQLVKVPRPSPIPWPPPCGGPACWHAGCS
jgi:IS30 family transposase